MDLAKFILKMLILLDIQERSNYPSISSAYPNPGCSTIQQSPYLSIQSVTPSDTMRTNSSRTPIKSTPMYKNPAMATCNATAREDEKTGLEFSQLLVKKMTQLVKLKLKGSKEIWNDISLYWVNNEIGMTLLNVKLFIPEQYNWLNSIDVHKIGYEEFSIPVHLEELKRNATCNAELLKNVLKQLRFSKTQTDPKIICDVFNKTIIVCCKQSQHMETCGVQRTAIYPYKIHWLMWLGLIFIPYLIFKEISAFLNNQIYEEAQLTTPSHLKTPLLLMSVPHNVILCKIMKLVCSYEFIIPKILFSTACFSYFVVAWTSVVPFAKGVIIYCLTSCLCIAMVIFPVDCRFLGKCFIKPAADEGIQETENKNIREYLWKHLCLGIKWSRFYLLPFFFAVFNCVAYSKSKRPLYVNVLSTNAIFQIEPCGKTDHDYAKNTPRWRIFVIITMIIFVNIGVLYVIISSAQLFLVVLEYTLLGLLLNAPYFFPWISFFTVVTIYISKSLQSFCEVYSSLLINVSNVLQENNKNRSIFLSASGADRIVPASDPVLTTWMVKGDDYERVRKTIESYPKNVSILFLKVVFIAMFAVEIYKCVDFLRDHAEASFDIKIVVLFGFTAFPYLVNILFWDQSENTNNAAEKNQCKKIKDILELK